MLHRFKHSICGIEIPKLFTWPFCYKPHELCRIATNEVQDYISGRKDWHAELQTGKMFGVLIVKDLNGELGYLSAFSGNLDGKNDHEYFVPPIYDALQPGDFFKVGETELNKINKCITELQASSELNDAKFRFSQVERESIELLNNQKILLAQRKAERDIRRVKGEDEIILIAESQREKADMQRLKKKCRLNIEEAKSWVVALENKINSLKEERKRMSYELQMQLFQQYKMLNARGEICDLCDIFAKTPQQLPPAGAGECAAPKLLQYAYQNELEPIAMAEFWWGNSPKGEIRKHGNFYPSCIGKCKPILLYMMQGLDVEHDPLADSRKFVPEILWEDDHIVIVNKPSGMLSVCGKVDVDSVEQWAKIQYPMATGPLIVHRLDQATSGILVIAKNKDIHKELQQQFITRQVKKSYIALLDGIVSKEKGEIDLPLKLDYDHRPCQMVASDGKKARTKFEVIAIENEKTRVRFYPITGRTHQLRVHSAHKDGLNAPIVGDELYGTSAERLCLHAESLEFIHPITKNIIKIKTPPNF